MEMSLECELQRATELDCSIGDHRDSNSGSEATSAVFAQGLCAAQLGGISGGSRGCEVAGWRAEG